MGPWSGKPGGETRVEFVKTAELRKLYIDYFVQQQHLLVPSSSLVPDKDPSVLLTTAEMQQFKPYFLGIEEPPRKRLCSVQKSFRTSDIDKRSEEHTSELQSPCNLVCR